jgi:hypothetical protein
MQEFTIQGPFAVPTTKQRARKVTAMDKREFWNGAAKPFARKTGCYVFALKRGRRRRPVYVGKADEITFERECFSAHNLNLLQEDLVTSKQLELFLLVAMRKGRTLTARNISALEQCLIEAGRATQGERLRNTQHARGSGWSIVGVGTAGITRSKATGTQSPPAEEFVRMMCWDYGV